MTRFRRLLPPVLMLIVAACSDTMGPLTQHIDHDVPEILFWSELGVTLPVKNSETLKPLEVPRVA